MQRGVCDDAEPDHSPSRPPAHSAPSPFRSDSNSIAGCLQPPARLSGDRFPLPPPRENRPPSKSARSISSQSPARSAKKSADRIVHSPPQSAAKRVPNDEGRNHQSQVAEQLTSATRGAPSSAVPPSVPVVHGEPPERPRSIPPAPPVQPQGKQLSKSAPGRAASPSPPSHRPAKSAARSSTAETPVADGKPANVVPLSGPATSPPQCPAAPAPFTQQQQQHSRAVQSDVTSTVPQPPPHRAPTRDLEHPAQSSSPDRNETPPSGRRNIKSDPLKAAEPVRSSPSQPDDEILSASVFTLQSPSRMLFADASTIPRYRSPPRRPYSSDVSLLLSHRSCDAAGDFAERCAVMAWNSAERRTLPRGQRSQFGATPSGCSVISLAADVAAEVLGSPAYRGWGVQPASSHYRAPILSPPVHR